MAEAKITVKVASFIPNKTWTTGLLTIISYHNGMLGVFWFLLGLWMVLGTEHFERSVLNMFNSFERWVKWTKRDKEKDE